MSDHSAHSGGEGLDQHTLVEEMHKAYEVKLKEAKRKGVEEESIPVFGGIISLPPATAAAVNTAFNTFKDHIRRGSEAFVRNHGERLLSGIAPEKAGAIANLAANAVGWGIIFNEEITGVAHTVGKYRDGRNELVRDFSSVLKAHGNSISYGGLTAGDLADNEVIQVEQERLNLKLKNALVQESSKLIASAPQVYYKMSDDSHRKAQTINAKPKKGESLVDFQRRNDAGLDEAINAITEKSEAMRAAGKSESIIKAYEDNAMKTALKASHDTKKEESEHTPVRRDMVLLGSAMASEAVNSSLRSKNELKRLKDTAFDKIRELDAKINEDPYRATIGPLPLDKFILSIFEEHQEDMKRQPIGGRFKEKLQLVCKEIAQDIHKGELNPMSLVDLVGSHMIVQEGGKKIVSIEDTHRAISACKQRMPMHFSVDADEILQESSTNLDHIQQTMQSLPPQTRDLYASIMPDELLSKLGMEPQEINAVHERTKPIYMQALANMVRDVATMPRDVLADSGLNDKEIDKVHALATKISKDGTQAVQAAVATHGNYMKGVEFTLLNADGYWKQLVHSGMQVGDMSHDQRLNAGHSSHAINDNAKHADHEKHGNHPREEHKAAHASSKHHLATNDNHSPGHRISSVVAEGRTVHREAEKAIS